MNSTMEKFRKSVNICQSYGQKYRGPFFWLTVYIIFCVTTFEIRTHFLLSIMGTVINQMTFTSWWVRVFTGLVTSRTARSFIRRLYQWVSKWVMNLPQTFIPPSQWLCYVKIAIKRMFWTLKDEAHGSDFYRTKISIDMSCFSLLCQS